MGSLRLHLLLEGNTCSTPYDIPINDRYSDTSTDLTLVSFNFTVESYGNKLIYDQLDTTHADMCFSNITIAHSVYKMNYENYFKDMFESIPEYREIVSIKYIFRKDKNLLREVSFSELDINRFYLEFETLLIEQHEKYMGYDKSEEESVIEKLLNK